jgi:hypothetical protein
MSCDRRRLREVAVKRKKWCDVTRTAAGDRAAEDHGVKVGAASVWQAGCRRLCHGCGRIADPSKISRGRTSLAPSRGHAICAQVALEAGGECETGITRTAKKPLMLAEQNRFPTQMPIESAIV